MSDWDKDLEFKSRQDVNLSRALLQAAVLAAFFTVGMLAVVPGWPAQLQQLAHTAKFWLSFVEDPQFYLLLFGIAAIATYIKLRVKYEKLVLSREGVRYVSPYGGPWSFLQILQPGWMLPWSEVDKVVVQTLSPGLGKHVYRLLIAPGKETKKSVFALSRVTRQLDYPLSWQRLPWARVPQPRVGRLKPEEMVRQILQSPLVVAFKLRGVAVEEVNGPINRGIGGYDIAQNRGLLTAVILAAAFGFYFMGDTFIAADYAYLSAPPMPPFVLMAVLGVWWGWHLGKTAPKVERSVISILLGAALAAALYPGMLRLNAVTATGEQNIYAYTQVSVGNFSPPDAGLPPIHLSSNYDYWGQFKNGSTHQFRVVRGALGFYQLDTGRIMDEVSAWWTAKHPG